MGDYFPGHISIGGKVPAKLVDGLCKAIAESGASLDYGNGPFEPENADELLKAAKHSGGTLDLMNDEAYYGQFEELEAFLVENQIPFDRHSDAKYEYDAERVMFRPGMKGPKGMGATNDNNVVVLAEDVMKVVGEMERFGTLTKTKLNEAITKLKELCGDDVPALEPLSIV